MVSPRDSEGPRPQTGGGSGIIIENVRSTLRDDEEEPRPSEGSHSGGRFPGNAPEPDADASANTLPLDPRIIKFSVGAIGNAAAEMTRYPGWRFSDDELEAIADALSELGLRMPAYANAILVVVAIAAGKATAYVLWVRAGKPPLTEATRRLVDSEPAAGGDNHYDAPEAQQ